MSCDEIVKICIIGDKGVGKTCLLTQYTENSFQSEPDSTIGVEFGSRAEVVMGKRINIQIWDTAGDERFRSITRSYYRGSRGMLITYDITRKITFKHIALWLEDARRYSEAAHIVLVGNKLDLEANREVTFLEGSEFAQKNGLLFFECSATKNETVAKIFAAIANQTQQATRICYPCREEFNSTTKRPLLLECFHTFCETCINAQTTQPVPSPAQSNLDITCPLCSKKTRYSAAISLPIDYAMQELVDAAEATKKRTCDIHDGTHEAAHWCFECEQGMCDEALNFHGKGRTTKGHQTLKVGVGAPVMRKSANCSAHSKEVDLVCTHTSHSPVTICISCAVTMHHGHPCVGATEYLAGKQTDLTILKASANEVQTKWKAGETVIAQEKDSLVENRGHVEKLIAAYFAQAREDLASREEELLSQLGNMITNKHKVLQTQQDAVLATIDGTRRDAQMLDASLSVNAVAKALVLMEQLHKRIAVSIADEASLFPRELAEIHFKSSPFVLPEVSLVNECPEDASVASSIDKSSPDSNSLIIVLSTRSPFERYVISGEANEKKLEWSISSIRGSDYNVLFHEVPRETKVVVHVTFLGKDVKGSPVICG